jgi:hypothetical protein
LIVRKSIRAPLAWLAVFATVIGAFGAALPVVLCISSDGHVGIEAPHAVGVADAIRSLSEGTHAAPCVDLGLHVSNQKEEAFYPALIAAPQLIAPGVVVIAAFALWQRPDRTSDAAPPPQAQALPNLLVARTIVLLT